MFIIASICYSTSYYFHKEIKKTNTNYQDDLTENKDKFAIGNIVVELKTDKQMKIIGINPDASFKCSRNGIEIGNFTESEIIDFKTYVKNMQ